MSGNGFLPSCHRIIGSVFEFLSEQVLYVFAEEIRKKVVED